MVECVADDGVFLREEWLEHTAVSIETSRIEDGVVGLEVVGNGPLQLFVPILRAANESHGRHAESPAVHHSFRSLDEPRMIRQS